ncbi:hypothetical protein [Phorcysia thermohydrogeniphila]|uniref:Lipoprotein n=1 Tax=Phorcysia thermohydrogeniphila TaxID=936138 RepID=A0A4R1GB46_9BACT|nr:hypothetical protein [Phorcysia thermohydrogeniphila]TCK02849.1 hypothetical protein CLV27_1556 [Phorcysia thermohydrogeniphila]
MKSTPLMLLGALLTALSFSCKTATSDYTITYPAGLIANHPKEFVGCYVKLVGRVSLKRPQDQFPPFSLNDALLCDSSGCIYIHDDTKNLKDFVGKRVKILGYGRVTQFNFPYVEVIEIKEAGKE